MFLNSDSSKINSHLKKNPISNSQINYELINSPLWIIYEQGMSNKFTITIKDSKGLGFKNKGFE